MIWPTLVVDNFFTDPDKIVEISKRYSYENDGKSPGVRTPFINQEDYAFFNWSTAKILALLYPNERSDLKWFARSTFHRVPPNIQFDGWIHQDIPAEFTVIIYLSKDGVGTSLFEPVSPEIMQPHGGNEIKYNFFKNPDLSAKELSKVAKAKEKNNADFRETLSIDGRYNRLFLFDAAQYHGVHDFKSTDPKAERLTYIIFFDKITLGDNAHYGLKYPGTESRRF